MDPAARYETDLPPISPQELHEQSRTMMRGAIDAYFGRASRESETRFRFSYALGRLEGERARQRGDSFMTLARRWWRENRYPMPERHFRRLLEAEWFPRSSQS